MPKVIVIESRIPLSQKSSIFYLMNAVKLRSYIPLNKPCSNTACLPVRERVVVATMFERKDAKGDDLSWLMLLLLLIDVVD